MEIEETAWSSIGILFEVSFLYIFLSYYGKM